MELDLIAQEDPHSPRRAGLSPAGTIYLKLTHAVVHKGGVVTYNSGALFGVNSVLR